VLREYLGQEGLGNGGGVERLHSEELNDLYCSSNIIRMIKSRRMRWAGHVAHMEERFWWENLTERDHLEDPGVDGRIILSWITRKWDE
jgi:hypothetical protein